MGTSVRRVWTILTVLSVGLLLCAVGTAESAGVRKLKAALAGKEPVRVVCFGDSVTGVYYHTGGRRAYSEMLELALKRLYPKADVKVINAGISGHTTIDALNRIDADVLAHKPQCVTVMFGLNDMTRVPIEDYEKNLSTIIAKCRGTGAEVFLCTPNSVAETPNRPIAKLVEYVAAIKRVGEREQAPVVDFYAAYETVREQDAFEWEMMMSDEIHPNMAGHKFFAEMLVRAITGKRISLTKEGPPRPVIPKTLALLKEGKPIKVYAMPPYDRLVANSLKALAPGAQIESTLWVVEGQTLGQIEEASKKVRELKPDLVVVAVPAGVTATTREEFDRSYSWVLNYSLSFAYQEWDCIAIPPSVTDATLDADARKWDRLARGLIRAQDLGMIERKPGDMRSPEKILTSWLQKQAK